MATSVTALFVKISNCEKTETVTSPKKFSPSEKDERDADRAEWHSEEQKSPRVSSSDMWNYLFSCILAIYTDGRV
jgi:hypothetical protein